jgi:type III secretion protein C
MGPQVEDKMKNVWIKSLLGLTFLSGSLAGDDLFLGDKVIIEKEDAHTISFQEVPVIEFIRFVSRISHVNFIFNDKELGFNISLSSGKPVSSAQVLQALVQILKVHGFTVLKEDGYLVIHRMSKKDSSLIEKKSLTEPLQVAEVAVDKLLSPLESLPGVLSDVDPEFLVYKLQYHSGDEIEEAVKKIAGDLKNKPNTSAKYLHTIQSIQWIKATNSLVCSGDGETLMSVKKLIESLDVALRQVFIEVLVVETDSRKSSEFGLEWAAGGKVRDSIGFGTGNFSSPSGASPFASAFKGINGQNTPTGPGQIPLGRGFDMGVIGDIIFHRGHSFLSLGALVSALQQDKDTSIVLNQKIITQDNKNSTIFVGDNIPFAGSLVETVGVGQQTTANIEYRDVGVTLSITPRLGEGDVITLDINEVITEAVENDLNLGGRVNGIQTTKTNMMTHVHVPDKHFLVLSGMIRNSKRNQKTGIPCLGSLPLIGSLFSKDVKRSEKRNVIVFVRPHIIRSMDDYQNLTQKQEGFEELSVPPVE